MCGIIGYIGSERAAPILIGGLESLEYRGYDSAGIALVNGSGLKVVKKEGRVASLKEAVAALSPEGRVGIGHTRWATHGKPSQTNAHPHTDADLDIAVVHNGIIENYQQLKSSLEEQGVRFASETDTEVIPHLLSCEVKKGATLKDAVVRVQKMLKGSYAFVALRRSEPGVLVGTRKGSPLILGSSADGKYFASDIPAIVARNPQVFYLEDRQTAVLTEAAVEVFSASGKPVEAELRPVATQADAADKRDFPHFMLKEIFEQPEVLRRLIEARVDVEDNPHFDELRIPASFLQKVERIYIVSCGTAYHAGYVGKYLLEEFTDIPVEIDISSEFRYRRMRLTNRCLMICVSQSGETADTLACLREAREKKCRILSVCNVVNSSIARESDGVIYTDAGPEIGVASTKAYTSQLVTFVLLSVYLARLRNQINELAARTLLRELKTIPEKIAKILAQTDGIRAVARRYHKANSSLYLGRGINFPTALEGALKNKEISYMHCEGHPAGEMKHGPIALINDQLPVVCVCPNGETYEKMLSNIREVEARDGIVISVATAGNVEIKNFSREVLYVPETIEELSPILNIIPLQLLAYYTALTKGCDIDKPRNLAKSVTVE